MSTVSITPPTLRAVRPLSSAHSTARNLRALMRDQGVTPAALAWIIRCSWLRALRLSFGSTSWTCTEVYRLVDACTPAPARRHEWAPIYAEAAA